jgi:UDP-N-acetylmuramate dehydrogenase
MVMAAARIPETMMDRLPPVRGRYEAGADLAGRNWFRVGGPAEVLFEPRDAEDLGDFLSDCPSDIPLTVIGFGSNLLVRDGGVPGVVLHLGENFAGIDFEADGVRVGAAALDVNVARAAQRQALEGLEFLSGIPGTIGGALRMNAGAYGGEMADIVIEVTALDREGRFHRVAGAEMGFGYRHTAAATDWIFIEARLRARSGAAARIEARMSEIAAQRTESQPRTRTGGSTFANPPGHKAWELIDRAGCRGLRRGGAMVSQQHCNFLINTGTATATDLEALGEIVRDKVRATTGIELDWEIRRIGINAGEDG